MYEEVLTMGNKVGVILDIKGKRLMYKRRSPSGQVGAFQAYKGMVVHLNDHFYTDAFTSGTIEFLIGCRASISPNTEIVVNDSRNIDVVGNQFIIKSAKMWHQIDKMNSINQINRSGGSTGLEG